MGFFFFSSTIIAFKIVGTGRSKGRGPSFQQNLARMPEETISEEQRGKAGELNEKKISKITKGFTIGKI